jgi:phage-related holin
VEFFAYRTLVRPIVTCDSVTQVLKENSIQKLMIFERKKLMKIFGITKELNGLWIIKTNEELDELIQRNNVIRFICLIQVQLYLHCILYFFNR